MSAQKLTLTTNQLATVCALATTISNAECDIDDLSDQFNYIIHQKDTIDGVTLSCHCVISKDKYDLNATSIDEVDFSDVEFKYTLEIDD